MAIAFRSASTLASATRTNSTVTAPAGFTTNDVVVVALLVGGSATTVPTQPGGWTQISTSTYTAPDPWSVNLTLWIKAYDGASSWTWTHVSRSTQAYAMVFSGVDNTTPLDVAGTTAVGAYGAGTGATAVAPTLTTVNNGARIIIARGSWDGVAITAPAGWTERSDTPVLWVGDLDQTTAGATGAISVTAGNTDTAMPWGIIMGALRPATGSTSGSVTAVRATATATGRAPTVAGGGGTHSVFGVAPPGTPTVFNDAPNAVVVANEFAILSGTYECIGARIYVDASIISSLPALVQLRFYQGDLFSAPGGPPENVAVVAGWNSVTWATPITLTAGVPFYVGYQFSDTNSYLTYPSPGTGAITSPTNSNVTMSAAADGRSMYRYNDFNPEVAAGGQLYGIDIIVQEFVPDSTVEAVRATASAQGRVPSVSGQGVSIAPKAVATAGAVAPVITVETIITDGAPAAATALARPPAVTGTVAPAATGTASITLSATGAPSTIAAGSGLLTLSATGGGTAAVPVTGTAFLSLSAAAVMGVQVDVTVTVGATRTSAFVAGLGVGATRGSVQVGDNRTNVAVGATRRDRN